MLEERRRLWESSLKRIKEWVKELVGELKKNGIEVEKVILFGSYARGDFSEGSDVDLIVVSSDWAKMEPLERLKILYRIWNKPIDANFLAYTPEEFKRKVNESVVLMDASKYWKVIYERELRTKES